MILAGAWPAMVAEVLGDSVATVLATYVNFFRSDTERARELLSPGLADGAVVDSTAGTAG